MNVLLRRFLDNPMAGNDIGTPYTINDEIVEYIKKYGLSVNILLDNNQELLDILFRMEQDGVIVRVQKIGEEPRYVSFAAKEATESKGGANERPTISPPQEPPKGQG